MLEVLAHPIFLFLFSCDNHCLLFLLLLFVVCLEWIGPATVLYVATQLLSLYGKDDKVTAFVKECEFTIIPLVNPDGYE